MMRLFHHSTREIDGISHVTHAGHGPGALLSTVHDRGVQLRCTVPGESRSVTRVEQRVIFQKTYRHANGVQARSAVLENRIPGVQCRFEAGAVLGFPGRCQEMTGHRPCPTVDRDGMH
jgi:hypothetical protein